MLCIETQLSCAGVCCQLLYKRRWWNFLKVRRLISNVRTSSFNLESAIYYSASQPFFFLGRGPLFQPESRFKKHTHINRAQIMFRYFCFNRASPFVGLFNPKNLSVGGYGGPWARRLRTTGLREEVRVTGVRNSCKYLLEQWINTPFKGMADSSQTY